MRARVLVALVAVAITARAAVERVGHPDAARTDVLDVEHQVLTSSPRVRHVATHPGHITSSLPFLVTLHRSSTIDPQRGHVSSVIGPSWAGGGARRRSRAPPCT